MKPSSPHESIVKVGNKTWRLNYLTGEKELLEEEPLQPIEWRRDHEGWKPRRKEQRSV